MTPRQETLSFSSSLAWVLNRWEARATSEALPRRPRRLRLETSHAALHLLWPPKPLRPIASLPHSAFDGARGSSGWFDRRCLVERRGSAQGPPLHAQVGRRRSALAAQTKSLSVRPSILWVQIFKRTLPQVRKISG